MYWLFEGLSGGVGGDIHIYIYIEIFVCWWRGPCKGVLGIYIYICIYILSPKP